MMCHMREGFSAAATAFFTEFDADTSRSFWLAHRDRYDRLVRPPFLDLITGIGGEWRVYRPHNDTRFGRGAPYKTFIGAVTERPDGIGAFVQVGPRGLLVGTGMPMPARDQLARWRASIGAEAGAGLPTAVDRVEATRARVHGGRHAPLARVPRGWPGDHPRGQWLRWKGVEVTHRPGTPAWLDTARAPEEVRALIAAGEPVHEWLAANVGPSELTPEERFARR